MSHNVIPGVTTWGLEVMLYDRATGSATIVATDAADPEMSRDGSHLTFQSWSTGLVPDHGEDGHGTVINNDHQIFIRRLA